MLSTAVSRCKSTTNFRNNDRLTRVLQQRGRCASQGILQRWPVSKLGKSSTISRCNSFAPLPPCPATRTRMLSMFKINLDPASFRVERDTDFSKLHNAIYRNRSLPPFNMGDVCESVASCFLVERPFRLDGNGNCLPFERLAVSSHSNGSFVERRNTHNSHFLFSVILHSSRTATV